jgi:hypothetical protein
MRDTYLDCPDRERAQWTGDAVNESGQAFYALSPEANALSRKWLHELVDWQKANGQLYAPVPQGNWTKELSGQVLSSVGYFGLWNYYLHTGDRQTLVDLYDRIRRYLNLYVIEENGLVRFRTGEWAWGDWGSNVDLRLIHNVLYYHAVKGMRHVALTLGKTADAQADDAWMTRFRHSFNATFWNGSAYRHPDYKGATDDRVQALAAVAGIPDPAQYPALMQTLMKERHASPYMERYTLQALFDMGYPREALQRFRERYRQDIDDRHTTLHEIWGLRSSVNHSWSGGALILFAQYLCGVKPLTPAYKTFQVMPRAGDVDQAALSFLSVAGAIASSYQRTPQRFTLQVEVPQGTQAILAVEKGYRKITLNGKVVWRAGEYKSSRLFTPADEEAQRTPEFEGVPTFKVQAGKWTLVATK